MMDTTGGGEGRLLALCERESLPAILCVYYLGPSDVVSGGRHLLRRKSRKRHETELIIIPAGFANSEPNGRRRGRQIGVQKRWQK
jgi:hypothetical protein